VLEAGLNTKYGVPTGVIIGTCCGLGVYCTACLFVYMRYLVRLEAQRLRVVCTHLTSNYGRLKVTFDVDEDDRQVMLTAKRRGPRDGFLCFFFCKLAWMCIMPAQCRCLPKNGFSPRT
jgi:hypothetical protein